VHVVTEDDLREIYGPGDPVDFVAVGRLASAESIPALVNINKLVTRHPPLSARRALANRRRWLACLRRFPKQPLSIINVS